MTKRNKPHPQQLLVEGMNDFHVICALCEKYNVPETFCIPRPDKRKGSSEAGEKSDAVVSTIEK